MIEPYSTLGGKKKNSLSVDQAYAEHEHKTESLEVEAERRYHSKHYTL